VIRLLALDVDSTIARPNEPIENETLYLLRQIEGRGVRIMLMSGKPAAYLAGFGRQSGLHEPIIAGENGAVCVASPSFPPAYERVADVAPDVRALMDDFARDAVQRFGDAVWLQPNRVNVSVFWRLPADAAAVRDMAGAFMDDVGTAAGLRLYDHADCIELIVPGADKGTALKAVMAELGIEADDVVAVGDSFNDVPAFAVAGTSLGIRFDEAQHEFGSIDDALRWVIKEEVR